MFEQLPGDLGVTLHERPEVPERHDQRPQVGRGGDGGGADAVTDEGDLAEIAIQQLTTAPAVNCSLMPLKSLLSEKKTVSVRRSA